MDISSFGDDKVFKWNHDYLFQVLTGGKKPILQQTELIEAFASIDRADFVPPQLAGDAYQDKDLEFGFNQTLTSPLVIAEMLTALRLLPGQQVLELGTGTGYTAALIAFVVGNSGRVYSLERNQQILGIARTNLAKYQQLGNIELIFTDARQGLAGRAPFDAIHVTFSSETVPEELLLQLKVGGRLVTPLTDMQIKLYTRIDQSNFNEQLIAVRHFARVLPGVE